MKRTFPLLITAIAGFVLIAAVFIPVTEKWGEAAAQWFDILAAIAFILGGGNLMKIHLKKMSDRAAGWGFSGVTLIAFIATLVFGLFKVGTSPAPKQEFYGEVFAPLQLEEMPESQVYKITGEIPVKGDGKGIPPSARRQLSQDGDSLIFHGWMRANQKKDLMEYQDELEWQATIEDLYDKAQPNPPLKGKVVFYVDHRALSFKGYMSEEEKEALLALGKDSNTAWKNAVDSLYKQSRQQHSIAVDALPQDVTLPENLKNVRFDKAEKKLSIDGPMSSGQRDSLVARFPVARPLRGDKRQQFLTLLESKGEKLNETQLKAFKKMLDGGWTADQLKKAINDAGMPYKVDKTAKEMLAEKKAGVRVIEPKKTVGKETKLNDAQLKVIDAFVDDDDMTVATAVAQLKAAGELTDRQADAFETFTSQNPTVGKRNQKLLVLLLAAGPVSERQREFLTADYQREYEWQKTVDRLFLAAHTTKYAWSGEYNEQGSPFWWMYEYAFKPLTATMFAMLAFYVASAAFRAFRAKNFEAMLLLGTAFIILLGRTSAGVTLTAWLPDAVSGLRIDELTVYIMKTMNTAGNRAIMIGVALGIASTSLKVLLGVDRSYLGSGED